MPVQHTVDCPGKLLRVPLTLLSAPVVIRVADACPAHSGLPGKTACSSIPPLSTRCVINTGPTRHSDSFSF